MKISVVVPAYNEEKFLPRLLTSLKNQTYKHPFEIIVVNNNSTDKTAEIAKSYGVKVIFESKRGYGPACQKGFQTASGDIIARADSDYVVPKHWLEKIATEFASDPKLIAIGGPHYPLETSWWENVMFYPALLMWQYGLKLTGRGFFNPNMAVRREYFKKSGGFDTDIHFGEDTNICAKLMKLGRVKLCPSLYIHTSIRRMNDLGLFKTVVSYSFGNQIALMLGREATVGLIPVRVVPNKTPHPHRPWPYLWAPPIVIFLALLAYSLSESATPATVQGATKHTTFMSKFSALDKNIVKFTNELRKSATPQPNNK